MSNFDFIDDAIKNGTSFQWTEEAKQKFISANMQELTVGGVNVGRITNSGYKAIESGSLDSYTPVNEEERKTLNKYRLRTGAEIKKDDGTSLGFVSLEGLKALEENNTKNYTPINDDEAKTINSYIEYATQKRQEAINAYKVKAQEELEIIEKEKGEYVDKGSNLRHDRAVASRTGKKGTEWEVKDTRTGKEKREGKPIPKSSGAKKIEKIENEYKSLDEKADTLIDDISAIEKYATVVYGETGFGGQAKANYGQGRLSQDTAQAYNDYVVSPTEENKMRAEAYSALSEQFNINNKNALTMDDENVGGLEKTVRDWVAVSLAQYLPQFIDQTKASVKGAVAMGATGAAVGSVVPGIGTLTGLSYGAKAGWVMGAAQQMFETTRGMVFKTLVDAGYDEETAKKAATDEAFISSIIEGGGEILSMMTLGTGKLVSKIAPKAATKVSNNIVVKGIKTFAKKTGETISKNAFLKTTTAVAAVYVNAIGEYAEEYSQEAVSIANERRLKNNSSKSLVSETISVLRDKDEVTSQRLHAAGQQGFRVGLMMGGATKAGTSVIENQSLINTGKKIKDADIVNSVINTGLKQPKDSNAYKLAEKAQQKLYEKGDISNAKLGQLANANKGETVNVGETYYDTNSKATFRVLSRNDNTTTVEMTSPEGTRTVKPFSNENADNLATGNRFVVVDIASETIVEQPSATNAEQRSTSTDIQTEQSVDTPPYGEAVPYSEIATKLQQSEGNTTTDLAVVMRNTFNPNALSRLATAYANKGSEFDITMFANDIITYYQEHGNIDAFSSLFNDGGAAMVETLKQAGSAETTSTPDAQTYNIIVSNLKRKAEELGLLDRDFFTRLQGVSAYNPTANDKALISSEFHRVFKGNTDPLVASWLNSIDVAAETNVLNSDLNGDIINTQNSEGVNNNGTDSGTDLYKNDNRYSEMQTEGQTGGVDNKLNQGRVGRLSKISADRRSDNRVETRTLETLLNDKTFIDLSAFVGNEISYSLQKDLFEQYQKDTRITEEDYDFSAVVAYDMLTNPDNELRGLFADEIEAYFNVGKSLDTDITGRVVDESVLDKLKNTVVKDENGQLIPVYHATNKEFDKFEVGDIGFHFGSYAQAYKRAQDQEYDNPTFIKAYLNITNPLIMEEDFSGWNAFQIAKKLKDIGILTEEEALEYWTTSREDKQKSNDSLTKLLQNKNYDGVVYNNNSEAVNGQSYIVFDDSQIIRIDDGGSSASDKSVTKTQENDTKTQYDHLYDEKKVSKAYLDSVNPEIENAIISIRDGDIDRVPDVIDVAKLDESTIKAISELVGFDISGYTCKIEKNRLVHIENRHGINGEHDHSLSDPKDTARMGYVINNSDNIDWVVDGKGNRVFDKQYNDKNNKPSPVIMLNSKIDGTYCISQAVPDSKKKTVWITSARIQKAAVGSQVPYDSNATPQLQTSKTPLNSSSASNNIVSQDDNIVNDSIRNNAENDASKDVIVKVSNAIEKTLRPEILSNNDLMSMLADKFGDDGISGLADEIISRYEQGESIGDFEGLFSDGGKEIYDALNDERSGNAKYSISTESEESGIFEASEETITSFSAQIDRWLKGEMKPSEQFDLGTTPYVLQVIGAENLPVMMNQNVLVKITGEKHSISLDEIAKMPNAIADPIMVFKSETVDNAFVVLTELIDKNGNDVVVAMHLNRAEKHIKINRISSAYGKENIGSFIINQINKGNLIYANENKIPLWSQSRGLQLPKLADTIRGSINNISYKDDIVNSYYMQQDAKYSAEGEIDNGRNSLLSDGSGKRTYGTGTGKQTKRVDGRTKRYREGRTAAYERKKYCRTLKASGLTQQKIIYGHKCEVIPPEHYTPRMNKMAEQNKKNGFAETIFITGKAEIPFVKDKNGKLKKSKGIYIKSNGKKIVVVQYDNEFYTPEQINDHETIHDRYHTPLVQKAKNIIINSLPVFEKKRVLEKLARDYNGIINNEVKEELIEEFVANVLSDMEYAYSEAFAEIQRAYWAGDEQFIDNYKVSEYAESIDAGGATAETLNSMGVGNDYRFSGSFNSILYDEYMQLREYIMKKNNRDATLLSVDCKEIGNNFYIWNNNGKTDFVVIGSIPIVGNESIINAARSEISNGTYRGTENFNARANRIRGGKRGRTVLDGRVERTAAHGRDDRLSVRQSGSNTGRYSSGDSENNKIKYALSTDDVNTEFWEEWLNKAKEYGVIPKGENPARDIDVPKKISETKVVSRFARTMLEAGVTPETAVSEFEQRILDGSMTYEVITNENAKKWAVEKIKYLGFEEALNEWDVLSRAGKIGKKELVLGMELYNQCVTNGDITNAMKIAAELASEATRAGQTVQACRMLKLMSPDGQLYYLEKSIQKMNEEFRTKIGDKYKDIKLNEKLMKDFLTEKDADKRNAVYDEICQDIADQIPATFLDKWNSWRYLAMLGNARTHIRNIIGNGIFLPAIRIKNYVGAVIESAAGVKAEERTKSFNKTKESIEFAKKDFAKMTKVLQGENAKYAVTSDIEGKRTIFKTRWLEALRVKNFEFLEKEDMWFLRMHYVDALARLITARKLDVNNIDNKTLETIRAYAIKEAQAATYRDANALADALNRIQRKAERSSNKAIRATSVLMEGTMPYKKTPLNIAKQGIYYSPVSVAVGTYKTLKKLKNGKAYNTSEIIDDFAKGLTGTGIILLGMFLASIGALSGRDDEDKKKQSFDKMTGEQSYAIKIGNKSYTVDWAAPLSLPLFVGVELYELTKDVFTFADVTDALSTLAEPLLELSVFSGINDVIESAQYSNSNAIFAIMSNMATSYVMQALPTIGGQASRIIDGNKREYYYVDKNSSIPKGLQTFMGQAASKIPFASYLFEPAIDEWGREETYGNTLERVFENVISPGYYSEENYTEVDKELKELYERTGESSVLPVIQQKKYTKDSVDYHMTAAEYTEVKRMRGQKSFELISKLFADELSVELQDKESGKYKKKKYSQMSDEEKVRAIEKCYKDAGDETKEKMFEKIKNHS